MVESGLEPRIRKQRRQIDPRNPRLSQAHAAASRTLITGLLCSTVTGWNFVHQSAPGRARMTPVLFPAPLVMARTMKRSSALPHDARRLRRSRSSGASCNYGHARPNLPPRAITRQIAGNRRCGVAQHVIISPSSRACSPNCPCSLSRESESSPESRCRVGVSRACASMASTPVSLCKDAQTFARTQRAFSLISFAVPRR